MHKKSISHPPHQYPQPFYKYLVDFIPLPADYIHLSEGKNVTNKQAIVTSAYGFLGRHVAKVFSENGFSVTGLGHRTWIRSEWQQWGLSEWHPCNITMESLNTYIQHLFLKYMAVEIANDSS